MMLPSQKILDQFIHSFQKAIALEMEAMRERLGPFEIDIAQGQAVDENDDDRFYAYSFRVTVPNDKLVINTECSLRCEAREYLVSVAGIDKDIVTLSCEEKVVLEKGPFALIIYPWFLYERLKSVLGDLQKLSDFTIDSALRVFGKKAPSLQSETLELSHAELNRSQTAAVARCCDSNLAFVWGPPGTGKTTTLSHIAAELLAKGHRILVTSTTNAAVDQALAKLKSLSNLSAYFERGQVLRMGQTDEDTHDASLMNVLHRLGAETQKQISAIKHRAAEISQLKRQCDLLLEKLSKASRGEQLDLFTPRPSDVLGAWDLAPIFKEKRIGSILKQTVAEQLSLVSRRRDRLEGLGMYYEQKIRKLSDKLRRKEADIISNSRLILATMSNVYISKLLAKQRFDVVIIEEAGMAILPTLFYCASLGRKKVILIGDPKQLPPIVQSREDYVQRAMGRNIFDVSAPDPYQSDVVVMLNTQYRMHPSIGNMVGRLFYGGKLLNDKQTDLWTAITEGDPYPGQPLIIADTNGKTRCDTYEGSYSRINRQSAALCRNLAQSAISETTHSVAIITPYVEQSRLIGDLISQAGLDATQVACRTVHRFQGNERDIVILDTVDTDPLKPGVLLTDCSARSNAANLVNVSISRARGKLIIVSDVTYFIARAPESVITKVLKEMLAKGIRISY